MCGPWPSVSPPELGRAGTAVSDPDTGNRILRVTESGSFGESPGTAYKVFDAGWRQAWNADNTRILVLPWRPDGTRNPAYWIGFDPEKMTLTREHGSVPSDFSDLQWDQDDPSLIVGLAGGVAKSYEIRRHKFATIFDPHKLRWRGGWISSWGGDRVCIAEGPQDEGRRVICYDRRTGATRTIHLGEQTSGGRPFRVLLRDRPVSLPRNVGIHTITLAPDGRWLAIDTHGNATCSVQDMPDYAGTALFIDLETSSAHEWNIACGQTHWAFGYGGVLIQSASPKWNAAGASGPCESDSRGIARRRAGLGIDTSFAQLLPCAAFRNPTWGVNVHLTWTNNTGDNTAPVVLSTVSSGTGAGLLWNEIAAVQTDCDPYKAAVWRFAQTWNDPVLKQCGFLEYSSPSVSRDGRWALFPSNWRGQTGSKGVCAAGARTDVFLFELR